MAARNVLTTFGEASQAPVLLGGAAITVLVVAGTTAADENGQWDLPFRLAVPLAMAALLLLPSLPSVAQDPAAPASLYWLQESCAFLRCSGLSSATWRSSSACRRFSCTEPAKAC